MVMLNSLASAPVAESGNGILKVREKDGMADLPERSLSRLLAVSHIASLSAPLSIQFKGLDMILVR